MAAYRAVMGVLRVSAAVVVLLALATTAIVEAPALVAAEPVANVVVAGPAGVSMDQAVKMAEQRFKARVVRAEAQRLANAVTAAKTRRLFDRPKAGVTGGA